MSDRDRKEEIESSQTAEAAELKIEDQRKENSTVEFWRGVGAGLLDDMSWPLKVFEWMENAIGDLMDAAKGAFGTRAPEAETSLPSEGQHGENEPSPFVAHGDVASLAKLRAAAEEFHRTGDAEAYEATFRDAGQGDPVRETSETPGHDRPSPRGGVSR